MIKNFSFLFIFLLFIVACEKDEKPCGCPPYSIIPSSPYDDPVWHPSGNIIGFNHRPIKEINYYNGYDCPLQAGYTYEEDSAGFWLINANGTNQRRILPYFLQTPAWSPDGEWIAFVQGAQILKMPFDGEKFDTTNIVQLTFEGRNFFPSWSPNNEEIVYNESICNEEIKCGIWIYSLKTGEFEFICDYGNYPDWHPFSDSVVFLTNAVNKDGVDIGDSIWLYNKSDKIKTLITFMSSPYCDNRYLQFSPFGKQIAFTSAHSTEGGIQLYIINSDGNDFKKLTTEGCESFSWSSDGKIVYLNYDYGRIDETKGTLWIMDADGNNKHQLTFNNFNLIQ